MNEKPLSILKVGAAAVDITPQPGIPLTGFVARQGPSVGVHDPLFAKALVLQSGSQTAAVITCDLLALDADFVASARTAIREATNIPEQAIMIACTHTHSGPATIFLRECGEVNIAYLNQLQTWLVEVTQKAAASLRPATVGIGFGKVERGTINRRQAGSDTDTDLSVVALQDGAGLPIATLVNYACHPVCLDHANRMISADYPGVLTRKLQEQIGGIAMFLTGAAGDINPACMGNFGCAEELGNGLAAVVLQMVDSITYREITNLRVTSQTIDLPLGLPPTSEELIQQITNYRQQLQAAEQANDAVNQKIGSAMLGWAESTLAGILQKDLPANVSVELQWIQIGDASLVGIPGEVFSGLGKEIKQYFSPHGALLFGYANGDIGYIPNRAAYASGGYEINEAFKYYGYPAVLSPEAGDLLLAAIHRWAENNDGDDSPIQHSFRRVI